MKRIRRRYEKKNNSFVSLCAGDGSFSNLAQNEARTELACLKLDQKRLQSLVDEVGEEKRKLEQNLVRLSPFPVDCMILTGYVPRT